MPIDYDNWLLQGSDDSQGYAVKEEYTACTNCGVEGVLLVTLEFDGHLYCTMCLEEE